jgi:transketolase
MLQQIQPDTAELAHIAAQVRADCIRSVYHAKGGHIGGPLSCTDILVALYFHVMNIRPEEPRWEDRDRFILSKGHSSIALYATMAACGYFPREELDTFDAINSRLQGHPDMTRLPGLDMSTGSLGQGLSPGIGMGLGARLLGKNWHTWVVLGDGE